MGVCHQEECQEGTRHPGEPENISLLESKVKDISWPGAKSGWLPRRRVPGGHLAPMRSQEIQVVEKQVETKSIGQGPKMVGCHREKSSWCSEAQ